MRTIRLQKMQIVNFKGIQNLTIDFDGKNTLISGYNGIGKSTIADAYFWLTTGKNATGAQRFEARPRDKDNNEVHNVITTVEATFKIDEISIALRRDELEDLTDKERNELKPETIARKKSFYFIDGAPYGEKVFYAKIAQFMCDKEKLILLSNPMAFFMLDDKVQRDILTAACGDVADNEIDGYDKVKEVCGAIVTPTEKRDGLQKTIKAVKKRLDEIPAQVKSLAGLCDEYADYDKQIAELEKEQVEVKAQNEKLKGERDSIFGKKHKVLLVPSIANVEIARQNVNCTTVKIAELKRDLEIMQDKKAKVCPNCGFDLDNKQAQIDLFKDHIKQVEKTLENDRQVLAEQTELYNAAMQEYNAKVAEQAKADEEVAQVRQVLEGHIEALRNCYTELSVEISKLQQAKQVQEQIKALRDERKTLDSTLAETMTQFDIISAFLIKKAEAVVENINKRFERVKFKLFDMQTNGELKPCCKALIDGVSYAGTNTASKAQVGIELIKLLSNLYDVTATVWVDDKESVIDLPTIDAQTICLKVDERYKELHIEAV